LFDLVRSRPIKPTTGSAHYHQHKCHFVRTAVYSLSRRLFSHYANPYSVR